MNIFPIHYVINIFHATQYSTTLILMTLYIILYFELGESQIFLNIIFLLTCYLIFELLKSCVKMFSVNFKNSDLDRNLGQFLSKDFFNNLSLEFTEIYILVVFIVILIQCIVVRLC